MTTRDSAIDDCVAYGYAVLVPRRRPEFLDGIVSRSRCRSTHLTDVWLDAWRERDGDMEGVYREAHDNFGMDRAAVDQLCLWYQTRSEVAMHGFIALSAAQEAVRDLLPQRPDVVIVGIGLPRKYVPQLSAPPPSPGTAGISPLILEALESGQALAPGGTILGFEPLVIDGEVSCSWRCNGIERVADQKLGIKTNRAGLLDGIEDADRVVQYIREDGHAEPGLWLPWLLVQY